MRAELIEFTPRERRIIETGIERGRRPPGVSEVEAQAALLKFRAFEEAVRTRGRALPEAELWVVTAGPPGPGVKDSRPLAAWCEKFMRLDPGMGDRRWREEMIDRLLEIVHGACEFVELEDGAGRSHGPDVGVSWEEYPGRPALYRLGPFRLEVSEAVEFPVPDLETRRRMAAALWAVRASGNPLETTLEQFAAGEGPSWGSAVEVIRAQSQGDADGDAIMEDYLRVVNALLDIARGAL